MNEFSCSFCSGNGYTYREKRGFFCSGYYKKECKYCNGTGLSLSSIAIELEMQKKFIDEHLHELIELNKQKKQGCKDGRD